MFDGATTCEECMNGATRCNSGAMIRKSGFHRGAGGKPLIPGVRTGNTLTPFEPSFYIHSLR